VPEVISGPASDVDLVRVWQVVSGTVVVTSGGRRLRAGAGAWLVLPGALVHQHIAAGTVLRSLGCRWRDAVGRLPLADMPPWEVPPRLHRDLDRAVIAIEGWIARHGAGWPDANAPRSVNRAPVDAVTYGRLQLALFTLLDVLLRDLSAAPVALAAADLSRAVAFLRSHGAGPYPGTAQVAAAAGLGVRTLEQRFVHDLGVTPAAWHRRLRVAEACRRLSGSDMSAAAAKPTVKAVARSLGFASAPIFRRWFHKACGCSPQAWQRRAHGP
jgi:AraC-like DNA-binding protein